ncbi:MAG: DUF429 domain-containing protein [Actinophytocola sp.]|nr:DUF429 domain-containing protein [Actinophytocola sp.]
MSRHTDRTARVLGVDACRAGWVGVVLDGDRATAHVASGIADLVEQASVDGQPAVVGVDMPIGLPDHGPRQADQLARRAVGRLRSSVFTTPTRPALEAPDHRTASARNRELTGKGVSIQAFGLKPKLLEVDQWVRRAAVNVVEVHPEVSFARLAGAPLDVGKRTHFGVARRHELLREAGVTLEGVLGAVVRGVGVDDVLDATVVAWSARRVAAGCAVAIPDPPEVFSDSWPAAIWI